MGMPSHWHAFESIHKLLPRTFQLSKEENMIIQILNRFVLTTEKISTIANDETKADQQMALL